MQLKCNKCGRKLGVDWLHSDSQDIEISFGYSSRLFDGETWKFRLCDYCLDKLAKSFIIPPEGYGYDPTKEYGEALLAERGEL